MKLLLIFIVPLVSLTNARSLEGRASVSCLADYLTSKHLIKGSLGSGLQPNQLCLAIVDVTKHNILNGVREQLLSDETMRDDAKCIINHLSKSNFGDYLLVTYVYETQPQEEETQTRLDEAEGRIKKATFDSFMVCQAEKKFSKVFTSLFTDDSTEEELTPEDDYCFRKHIEENKLITVEGVHLNINPKELNINSINCGEIFPKALKNAEAELVKAITEESSSEETNDTNAEDSTCVLEVIKENKFIEQMIQFDYLREYTLQPEQKEIMRQHFVVVMSKIAEKTSKCFL
jgi:hypothetical protein